MDAGTGPLLSEPLHRSSEIKHCSLTNAGHLVSKALGFVINRVTDLQHSSLAVAAPWRLSGNPSDPVRLHAPAMEVFTTTFVEFTPRRPGPELDHGLY